MLKAIQKFLFGLLLIILVLFLGYQALMYNMSRDRMPQGLTIAGVDVSGLTREEAAAAVNKQYYVPLTLHHVQEQVPLNPQDVGFTLSMDNMLAQADEYLAQQTFWQGYMQFLIGRSLEPIEIRLDAAHDREALQQQLETTASFLDKPASAPQLQVGAGDYEAGEPGYITDIETSLPLAELALYQVDLEKREVDLIIENQDPIELNLTVLEDQLRREIAQADGLTGSIFVMDLQTGEEINIHADMALSGLSILKIPIFVEAYRALDRTPNDFEQGLFLDTAIRSSNFGANLLLHVIAGEENTYEGAAVLTASMQRLGLVNSFMAIPYDAAEVSTRPSTYQTPANSEPALLTQLDPARQTTAEDIGSLLAMVYYCAEGGGTLTAVYPDQITPDECQSIIDLMVLNEEGNLIRLGVPEDVPVSHKHGWDGTTYGDAGIVLSPGGDYVIVTYVTQASGWLLSDISFPILWELSRLTYNYFNFTDPYLDDPKIRAEKAAAELAAEQAIATAQAIEAEATPEP
ncbi:MAG: serine hydrolase [Chloroflexi bacterium]|nr:serine hydrolase [Chloroflexota bacterium]